jgi:hypothetical protein
VRLSLDALFDNDRSVRTAALAQAMAEREHQRSAVAAKIAFIAKEIAAALARAEEVGGPTTALATKLTRACIALSVLRVDLARSCLFRIADEGTPSVKSVLAHSLRDTKTSEGRAVLVHLLSDDDARADAIVAIGGAISAAPWPEALPLLIEVAEADDHAARLAMKAIGKLGAMGGERERNAAADFLVEALDDDAIRSAATFALLRYGATFPPIVVERAKRMAKEPGERKAVGLFLLAAYDQGNVDFLELAMAAKTDEAAARAFLGPLRNDPDARVQDAADRTWKVLSL